ncbi:MAG: histidine ammonia-lyase, partial [Acidimicrobiia bacterium]
VELLAAARAIDMRAPLGSSPAIAAARAEIRRVVPGPGPDRVLADELAALERLCASGALLTG